MDRKKIEVTFKTLTPLWTGDAWQDSREIKPSSLIGSLRFWFDVICYFGGVLEKKDFNFQNGRFEKEVDVNKLKNFIQKKGSDINEIIKNLIEKQNIPISSVIFGTTNWKSLIEIKEIFNINEYENYQYFLGKMDFPELKHYGKIPSWFFKKGFYGNFQIKFLVENEIYNSFFLPLLTFMDEYGFWGGKWNIGYGRLKIVNLQIDGNEMQNWRKETINLKEFGFRLDNFKKVIAISDKITKNNNKIDIIELINNFNELTQLDEKNKKIKVIKNKLSNNNPKGIIKELIKIKAQERANFKDDKELRHKIFGKTGNPQKLTYVPEGSKILPFIYEDNNQFKGGFLSIVGLLNLQGENNG